MKKALIPLADGFEDIEAVSIVDVLRRGGVEVVTASLADGPAVRSAHGIQMVADALLPDVLEKEYDAIILPGGGEGTHNLSECAPLLERLRRQKAEGGLVCAICAAPTVLELAEVIEDESVTCYPSCTPQMGRSVESVPVIAVITKSYSRPDRESNVQMVREAFSGRVGRKLNLKGIIPVVAELYRIDDTSFAPVDGIAELIQLTNDVMPEGIAAADKDVEQYKLERTNNFAHTLIGASTVSGVLIGAVPLPSPLTDGAILSGIELAEVNGLAKLYGIKKSNQSTALFEKIVEIGTVSAVARATCGAVLKVIPVAGWIANAAVAGSFVAAIGEGTRYIFEQIKLGNKSVQDIEWAETLLSDKLSGQVVDKAKKAFSALNESSTKDDVIKAIASMFDTKK